MLLGTERKIDFEGCFNFRDLGGYRSLDGRTVRWGKLFRSDALHLMSPADADHARRQLGISTVIDLRANNEVIPEKLGPLMASGVAYHHLPVIDQVRYTTDSRVDGDPFATLGEYLRVLREGGPHFARLLNLLAGDVYPAVFHCTAGKDRTGLAAALLLDLLGVSDDQIAEDYALTNLSIEKIVERMRTLPGYTDTVRDLPASAFRVSPLTMIGVLRQLRIRYGSVRSWVGTLGVGGDALGRLRDRLLIA